MTNINKELIDNCIGKMFLKLTNDEEKQIMNVLTKVETDFSEVEKYFPNIHEIEPMTHTVDIPNKLMREDIPVESPNIEELLKNSKFINGREIEVPKVVG